MSSRWSFNSIDTIMKTYTNTVFSINDPTTQKHFGTVRTVNAICRHFGGKYLAMHCRTAELCLRNFKSLGSAFPNSCFLCAFFWDPLVLPSFPHFHASSFPYSIHNNIRNTYGTSQLSSYVSFIGWYLSSLHMQSFNFISRFFKKSRKLRSRWQK